MNVWESCPNNYAGIQAEFTKTSKYGDCCLNAFNFGRKILVNCDWLLCTDRIKIFDG